MVSLKGVVSLLPGVGVHMDTPIDRSFPIGRGVHVAFLTQQQGPHIEIDSTQAASTWSLLWRPLLG